jgi:hypothetical protein
MPAEDCATPEEMAKERAKECQDRESNPVRVGYRLASKMDRAAHVLVLAQRHPGAC